MERKSEIQSRKTFALYTTHITKQVSDLNPKTGKKKTYLQSKYFFDKFGRNKFGEIIPPMYEPAIRYITKYLNKQNVKPY